MKKQPPIIVTLAEITNHANKPIKVTPPTGTEPLLKPFIELSQSDYSNIFVKIYNHEESQSVRLSWSSSKDIKHRWSINIKKPVPVNMLGVITEYYRFEFADPYKQFNEHFVKISTLKIAPTQGSMNYSFYKGIILAIYDYVFEAINSGVIEQILKNGNVVK